MSEGRCLMRVFLILKWKPWAAIIKPPIKSDDTRTSEGNQIPVTSKVANAIFETPTKLRVRSFSPNDLNSVMTLWYLNVHTYETDKATATWASINKFSIFSFNLIVTNSHMRIFKFHVTCVDDNTIWLKICSKFIRDKEIFVKKSMTRNKEQ